MDRVSSVTERFNDFKTIQSESLASEVERAKSSESSLNEKINSVNTALTNEIQRSSERDIAHTDLVNTESNRAKAVENKLSTDLDTEINRAKDSEKHILDEVHSVQSEVSKLATATNVYTKAEVDTKVNSVKNDIDTINNWVNNHNNDCDALNTKVNGIVADVDKAKADLLSEVAKCDAENTKQATDLQTLSDSVYNKSEVDTKVNDINSAVSALENWKNNHSDNTEGLNEKVTKLIADTEKLSTDLSIETNARVNADTTLTTKVEVVEGKVETEVERAKAQEKLISDEVVEIKENATKRHTELSDSIAETNANLTLEVARAKAAEKVLSDAVEILNGDVETSGSVKKSLQDSKSYTDTEITKLSLAKDGELADTLKVYAKKTDVDKAISDVVGSAPEAYDTLKKISDVLSQDSDAISAINDVLSGKANSEDVYNKTEIDSKVTAIENTISTETTKLSNADSVIDSKVEDLKTKVASIETTVNDNNSTLGDAISAEETARKEADKTISDKLDSEIAKVTDRVNELNAKVIQDIADSTAKDTEIDANISALNTLLSNVETKVDNEVLRSTEKDNELSAKDVELEAKINANILAIETEVNRSKQVEKELNDKINSIEIPVVDFSEVNSSISSLNASITQLSADSSAKDTELENSINVETNRAENAEKLLADKIDIINGDKETIGSVAHAVEDAKHHIDDKLADYQPKGDYLTEHQSLDNYYTKEEVNNAIKTLDGIDITDKLKDYAKKSETSLIEDSEGNRIPKLVIDLNDTNEDGIPVCNKIEIDYLLDNKANISDIPDISNLATKSQVSLKADAVNVYSKADTYNKTELNNMFANIIKTYTENEYEALSDEEKNNGLIIVI